MVNFNRPPYVGGELDNIKQAVENLKICGDGPFTKKCKQRCTRGTNKIKKKR